MPRKVLTYSSSVLDFGTVVEIVKREMEQNSPFNVEVTGENTSGSRTIKASAHLANVDVVGNEVKVTIDAPNRVIDAVRSALESQTESSSTRREPGRYNIVMVDDETVILSDNVADEVVPHRDASSIDEGLSLDEAKNLYRSYVSTAATPNDIAETMGEFRGVVDRRDLNVVINTNPVGSSQSEVSRTSNTNSGMMESVDSEPMGGARPTELLPDDAEIQATMRLYDGGMLVIERDGEKEMYETEAGVFLTDEGANELGVAEAYTTDGFSGTWGTETVMRAFRKAREILLR